MTKERQIIPQRVLFIGLAALVAVLGACAPRATVAEAPPPQPPVVYDAGAFEIYQAAFEVVSTSPGVAGWTQVEERALFGNVIREVEYGGSASWTIVESDRAAGTFRAETTNTGAVYNPTIGLNMGEQRVKHQLTFIVSGPDDTGPSQVVLSVSSARAIPTLNYLIQELDKRFRRQ